MILRVCYFLHAFKQKLLFIQLIIVSEVCFTVQVLCIYNHKQATYENNFLHHFKLKLFCNIAYLCPVHIYCLRKPGSNSTLKTTH